jgi:cyclopropane fatty-acyl-phospholipid synthase-like methyltransferase
MIASRCLILLLLLTLDTQAQDGTGQAPIAIQAEPEAKQYLGRTIAATMHYSGATWLTRDSRLREEDSRTMLRELRVKPGMHVCDMGCGNGFYTLQLARRVVPGGKIYAVDIQQEMLRLLEHRLQDAKIQNVELILGTVTDPQLPPKALDLVLCVDVYHEFSHPVEMLAAIRESLKPTGQIVLVEFREEDPKVPIKPLHKMSKRQIRLELDTNGFQLAREFDGLPWQHMMFFTGGKLTGE